MALHSPTNGSPRVPRRLLALGLLLVLAALAGCSSPGSVSLDPVDDTELAREASRGVDPGGDEADRVVREAVETGAANATSRNDPIDAGDDPVPYRYDGAHYELSSTVVDEETVYAAEVAVDYNATDVAGADAVRLAELPPADRRAVRSLFPPRTDRRTEGYEVGASAVYTREELANSTLADRGETTERVVAVDGERYRVRVGGVEEDTRYTYRYTAEEVFASDEAYADHLREQHLFVLSDLPTDEREVLTEATNETYHADGEDDAAFEAVVERFRSHDAVRRDEYGGDWLVRWEGQTYWVDLRYGAYATN